MNVPSYKAYYALIDFACMLFSFLTAQYILVKIQYTGSEVYFGNYTSLLGVYTGASLMFLFIFQANHLYKVHILTGFSVQLLYITKSLIIGGITLIIFSFTLKLFFFLDSRSFIFLFLGVAFSYLLVVRVLFIRAVYLRLSQTNFLRRRALIIGAGKAGQMMAAKLIIEKSLGIEVVGFIDDNLAVGEEIIDKYSVLGQVKDIEKLVGEQNIEELILAIDNIRYSRMLEILDHCKELGIRTRVSSELFEIIPQKMETEFYSDVPVVDLSPKLDNRVSLLFKRIADFIISTAGIILLSPLFILLALFIKVSSKGPVFYKSTRIGLKGKPFAFIKFRSMTVEGENDEERKKQMLEFMKRDNVKDGAQAKIVNKQRITWIGKIIRKYSLDEFPQLFNVLKGDMSLVGPRPCIPYEYEHFEEWQKRRHDVLPGCTGVWQVFGRGEVSFKDSVILDLYYINNMSPWLDIQLLLKTIPVLITGKGGK